MPEMDEFERKENFGCKETSPESGKKHILGLETLGYITYKQSI